MEKEELLSLAGVVALLVVGDADASEEDELSEPVSDGVVVPLAESEMVYPGDTAGDSTVPLSEIHPARAWQSGFTDCRACLAEQDRPFHKRRSAHETVRPIHG